MNCLEQEFCFCRVSIEVNGTPGFPLLQDPTTQITDAFKDKMTSLEESLNHFVGGATPSPLFEREKNFHTTSHPTRDPRMSNVLARVSLRNS